jgi:hypothetical protein
MVDPDRTGQIGRMVHSPRSAIRQMQWATRKCGPQVSTAACGPFDGMLRSSRHQRLFAATAGADEVIE